MRRQYCAVGCLVLAAACVLPGIPVRPRVHWSILESPDVMYVGSASVFKVRGQVPPGWHLSSTAIMAEGLRAGPQGGEGTIVFSVNVEEVSIHHGPQNVGSFGDPLEDRDSATLILVVVPTASGDHKAGMRLVYNLCGPDVCVGATADTLFTRANVLPREGQNENMR